MSNIVAELSSVFRKCSRNNVLLSNRMVNVANRNACDRRCRLVNSAIKLVSV